jgi:tetratricopeptide (TPR) repeat protein
MAGGIRAGAMAVLFAAASLVTHADVGPLSRAADVQLHLGRAFFADGRYQDALDAYRRALAAAGPDDVREARTGVVQSALRVCSLTRCGPPGCSRRPKAATARCCGWRRSWRAATTAWRGRSPRAASSMRR